MVDNHNFIYHMMRHYNLSENDVEDWYGTLSIAMCKAAMSYNKDKNIKFTTFAGICMQNEICMAYRKENKCVKGLISLNQEISNETDNLNFSDLISDSSSSEYIYTIELLEIIKNVLQNFNDISKGVIDLCCRGERQSVVAKEFGLSRSHISRIFTKFKKELQKELGKCKN